MQFDIMNGILALLYVILLIAWIPLIIRYWITWKRLKQYFIPFYIVVFIILVIMFEYRAIALIQVFNSFSLLSDYYFYTFMGSLVAIAAMIYFTIGALIAYRQDIVYNRFIDAFIRQKYKAKEISRKALFLGRYPEDVLAAVKQHPRVPFFSGRTLLGYILAGFAAFLLITWFFDPNVMLCASHYLPFAPQLGGILVICLVISLITAGLLILAEKWPYAGLAVIALTVLVIAVTIHIPYLLLTQVVVLALGVLSGIITLSKAPEPYVEPTETPPKLAALVTIKPLIQLENIAATGGGVTILVGGVLTHIYAIISAIFISTLIPIFSGFPEPFGVPLMTSFVANLFWLVGAAIAGFLAIIAGILVLTKRWRSGALLGLVCGIITLWVYLGIITIIGAIIVLAKYPRPDKIEEQHPDHG